MMPCALRRPRRYSPFHLALALLAAAIPAAADPMPLPGVGEVGQGIQWTAVLEPTQLFQFDSATFEARGVIGTEEDRLIGRLSIVRDQQGFVATGRFPALGGEEVRVALLDGGAPVAEISVRTGEGTASRTGSAAMDPLGEPVDHRGAKAPVTATGDVLIGPGALPTLSGSVTVSLFQFAGFASASGEVFPAPMLELDLGVRTQIVIGSRSFEATTVRFLSTRPFPPPGWSSAILQRVDVFTGSILGGPPPELEFGAQVVESGVLFSGVPVQPDEGVFGILFDHARGAISGLLLDPQTSPAILVAGDAAGVAVEWKAADLAVGLPGSSVELAAIGRNVGGVEVRGVVAATRTDGGWDLSLQPPSGLGDVPRTIEVDGEPVGEVMVPAPVGVFARAGAPPSGAAVFPMGLGEGAFYGFSWDAPVSIEVPGAGTVTGREVRLTFPQPIGPLAFGGLAVEGSSPLTLTGLAAPAVDDGGPCIASATRLCLAGGRFAVDAAWADPFGASGSGVARPLSTDTGAFWFFDEANLELMVKVLDACTLNERFWVFAGGLTNVEVELTVTDTRTGAERVYRNPQGQAFQPIQDTAAFATCGP